MLHGMGRAEPHPLVRQLRFTRSEFARGIRTVDPDAATRRLGPMNSISWNVGHLAWQEQRYFLTMAQGTTPHPEVAQRYASGGPASTPPLDEVLAAWRAITKAADPWLDTLTSTMLLEHPLRPDGTPYARIIGDLLQRTIYHYWFHNGENLAIRQQLGEPRLPEFVGDIDGRASYRP
jgi:hypothetical protein